MLGRCEDERNEQFELVLSSTFKLCSFAYFQPTEVR
ncbi:hypothetical protein D1AOALGA4SA_12871 [Olavius algarvensis Delta 1 endosymbiont]|nr:hypothetical protein D1AOALGA4SA_12871 [Olavius algarvensis Delta 1 endosymbiont]